jgi:glycosyltransferase involved in cell wall biosynthesis
MSNIEVSCVMPCLNEASTVGICVDKALSTMRELRVTGEVVVADNGSTDDSVAIAEKAGAKVVHQSLKGYGNAYLKGFASAQGKYLVMADADDSYDWSDLRRFIEPLRNGYDMVMGTRLGGEIQQGAMPFLHRYFGVPVLTTMLNLLYGGKVGDAHCGMRSFTKQAYEKMHLHTTGMEFASEMMVNAMQADLKIFEIPITLHPDGRPGKPHLKSFSDGWRHIRYLLNFNPKALYFIPGWILLFAGFLGLFLMAFISAMFGERTYPSPIWSIISAFCAFVGYQLLLLGIIAQARNYTGHFPKTERYIERFFREFTSGKGITIGLLVFIIGAIMAVGSLFNPICLMVFPLLGITLSAMGVITIFASFLLGQLNIFGRE